MSLSKINIYLKILINGENPDKIPLSEVIKEMDIMLDENRKIWSKQLVHFLERRSYVKALELVQEEMQAS